MKIKKYLLYTIIFSIVGMIALNNISPIWDFIKTSLFFGTQEIEAKKINLDTLPAETTQIPYIDKCDVLVVGGGAGGIAAAVQSARLGVKTCLMEDTNWLGGMFTAAGVSAFDGGKDELYTGGFFGEIRRTIEKGYGETYDQTQKCKVSYLCFEPSIANVLVKRLVEKESKLTIYYKSKVKEVYRSGNLIQGVKMTKENGSEFIIPTRVLVDATEFGDLMELGNVPYDLGPENNPKEIHTGKIEECIQPLTYVMTVKQYDKDMTIAKPDGYDKNDFICSVRGPNCPDAKYFLEDMYDYGRLPNGKFMINWPHNRWGNDFYATHPDLSESSRAEIYTKAKNYSLSFLYYLQTEMGQNKLGIYNEYGTADSFPLKPYVRESRRLRGVERITEEAVYQTDDGKPKVVENSIAITGYPIDLHYCESRKDLFQPIYPIQIPYGVVVPQDVDGFLVAEKNISVSHIMNGATRLQPVVISTGQAVGVAAAFSVHKGIQPRNLDINDIQTVLLRTGSPIFYYGDLNPVTVGFSEIMKVSSQGFFKGHQDGTFKPNDSLERRYVVKIAYDIKDHLEDREIGSENLNRALNLAVKDGVIQGQADINGKMAFNLQSPTSRAEAIKILLKTMGYSDIPTTKSYYTDVTGWEVGWVEQARLLGLIKGTGVKKFDPNRPITRAEMAILVDRLLTIQTHAQIAIAQ